MRSSGGRTGFRFRGHVPREPGNPAWLLKGGACCPEGGLWWRGPGAHAGFRVWARNWPAPARTKAISWGPPRCSSIRKGGSLYGWKNRGIFGVVVTGRWCLRVCLHEGVYWHPRPMCPSPLEAQGRLSRDAGVLRWLRNGLGTPRGREGTWTMREPPGNSPALGTMAPDASPGSCPGA